MLMASTLFFHNQIEETQMESTLMAHCGANKITRADLKCLPVPASTDTFKPIPHFEVVEALVEALGFRQISVVRDEYAASADGMRMFGVLDLENGFEGCRFSIGIRNSNDKSMRLALTVGYRVFVCDNLAFHGDFTPVLAKHSKHFNVMDSLAIGVDRMQRNFAPMQEQVARWRETQITDDQAKLMIYRAFIERDLEAPRYLIRQAHQNYFNPCEAEFTPRTMWSLSNAFTSAFKQLESVQFYKATAKLGSFLHGN
jgi:hypothetical protein